MVYPGMWSLSAIVVTGIFLITPAPILGNNDFLRGVL